MSIHEKIVVRDGVLDLSSKNVESINEIEGLGKVKDLKGLNLSKNKIREIEGLESLKNLEVLNLSSNKIREIKGLESLTNLRELYFGKFNSWGNKITEIKGLENLNNLEILDFSYCELSEIKGLDSLTNLKELYFTLNLEINEIKGLENLINLRLLVLAGTGIEELNGLESLKNLVELYLGIGTDSRYVGWNCEPGCNIKSLENLEHLTSLEVLDASDCHELKEIKLENPSVSELRLYDCDIHDISRIQGFPNLQTLYIQDTDITSLKGIEKFRNLFWLDLTENHISDLKELEYLEDLQYLLVSPEYIDLPERILKKFRGKLGFADIANNQADKIVKYCKKQKIKKEMKKEVYEVYMRDKFKQGSETIDLEESAKKLDELRCLLEYKKKWDGGIHHYTKEECIEIIEFSEKIIKHMPNDIPIWIVRGYAYYQQYDKDDTQKATKCFERVLEIDPEESEGWLGLARVYIFSLNDKQKGVEYLEKAFEVDPYNKWMWGEIADTYHNIDSTEKAIEWFENLIYETDYDEETKDYYYAIIGRLYSESSAKISSEEYDIKRKISEGEGPTIEFKSSLRWDIRKNCVNKELEHVAVKEISGFLNSKGGILFIGIDDDGNMLGLDKDYQSLKKKDKDGFQLQIVQLIGNYIGNEFGDYWRIKFLNVESKEICAVEVDRSPEPVYTKKINKNGEDFYIRKGSLTKPLDIRVAHKYISHHFKKMKGV